MVGAALRADRAQRTPRRGVPTNSPPYQLAALPTRRPTSAAAVTPEACPYHANPSVGAALRADRPTSRPHTMDASERRPYQHHARLAFTLHKQKPAAFLPRALFILCHCERRPAFTPQTCLCFLRSSRTKVFRKSSTNQRLIFATLGPKHIAKCIRQCIWRSFFCSNPNVCIDFCGRLKMVLDIPIRKSHFFHNYTLSSNLCHKLYQKICSLCASPRNLATPSNCLVEAPR